MDSERKRKYERLLKSVADAVGNERQKNALYSATERFRLHREDAIKKLVNSEQLKQEARNIRIRTVANTEAYLETLTRQVQKRGGIVFRARDAQQAVRYVVELAEKNGVKLVVKTKSMTTEEIRLNHALEDNGIQVFETDLGERIIQLAGERPTHMIGPAVHKTRYEVAELFSKNLGRDIPPEPKILTQEARRSLREAFLKADMGISGINLAVAETGTLILVTNEGNGRLVTSLPRVHVAIMGEEKVVPNISDAVTILELLPRSATGQKATSYITFINGVNDSELSSSRQLHLIILDNGRSLMRQNEGFRDASYCIRCGACLSVCPTYRLVGGHVFGDIHMGPIGIPWVAFTSSLDKAGEISPLCINCGLCATVCPVGINIPTVIMRVKQHDVEEYGQPRANLFIARLEGLSRVACATAPVSNWLLENGSFRFLMEKVAGLDRRRRFPRYNRNTFIKWFKNYHPRGSRKVAYFVDVYANYNDPDLGRMVVNVLERNDVEVAVPPQRQSGMPYLSYGNIKLAEDTMKFNVESFGRLVEKGYDIVASEPTAAFCLKKQYPELLGDGKARLVAEHSFELFEYLDVLRTKGIFNDHLTPLDKMVVGYQTPCHTKGMFSHKPVVKFLEMLGLDVKIIDYGCCGIAGTFGYKHGLEGYELSMELGKRLFDMLKDEEIKMVVTESSVCKLHMEGAIAKTIVHPARLLSQGYATP